MSDDRGAGRIETLEALRRYIPAPPAMMQRRLQPRIDAHCLTVIRAAAVCIVGFAGHAGFAFINLRANPVVRAEGDRIDLIWPADTPLPPALAAGGRLACSLYFIMPGIGFALRANGAAAAVRQRRCGNALEFVATALFLHCSRAKVRARFWVPRPALPGEAALGGVRLSDAAQAFVAATPYLLLLTEDAAGRTELSPRGDPEGFVRMLDPGTLLIPERPGNKVACTLGNILTQPRATAALLRPGGAEALIVDGHCRLTDDSALLAGSAVAGKAPKIGILLAIDRYRFQPCPQWLEAGLWSPETHLAERDLPSFAKMLAEHMNGTGLAGKATTLLVDAVVRHDLKHLY